MSTKPPPLLLAISDAPRAVLDAAFLSLAAPKLRRLPRAKENHSVMVIPGFMGSDTGNQPLIRFLNGLGYTATGWLQGRNLGPGSFAEEDLRGSIDELARAGGGKVSLVGHSLGGIYAREIARMEPSAIHQVITLGSPFGRGQDTGSHARRMYDRLNPEPNPRENADILDTPPPVPTTAIYTKADGIVNWKTSRQSGYYDHVDNIEVQGSHIGLNLNAAVWFWIARKLAAI